MKHSYTHRQDKRWNTKDKQELVTCLTVEATDKLLISFELTNYTFVFRQTSTYTQILMTKKIRNYFFHY